MPDLLPILAFDIFLLLACSLALWRFGRLTALHPAVIYLFFHVYVVTLRVISLALGGAQTAPMLSLVTQDEMIRVTLSADVSLLVMTVAWLWVGRRDFLRHGPLPTPELKPPPDLDVRTIKQVALIILPIGLLGLFLNSYAVNNESILGDWQSSSYLIATATWPILSVLMLIYGYGFKWWLMVLLLVVLGLTVLDAPRYAFVVPVIFLCYTYLSQRGRHWFPIWMWLLLVTVGVLWFPLKQIVSDVRSGDDVQSVVTGAVEYYQEAFETSTGDTNFLDQAASVMTLVDRRGDFYYGSAWAPYLVSPIPRQWWPDKPRLNEYLWEISTVDRPMSDIGMIPTLVGDSYVNFGYIGVVIVPFIVAFIYGAAHFHALRRHHFSLARLAYIVFASILIQVYRDGVMAIFLFTFVNSMPFMFLIFWGWLRRRARLHQSAVPADRSTTIAPVSRS